MGYFFSLVIHNISYRKDKKGAGLEYIFLPGDSTKNAKEAAKNAFENIENALGKEEFERLYKRELLQIKYLDASGKLQTIKNK